MERIITFSNFYWPWSREFKLSEGPSREPHSVTALPPPGKTRQAVQILRLNPLLRNVERGDIAANFTSLALVTRPRFKITVRT